MVDDAEMLKIFKTRAPKIILTSEGALLTADPGARIYYTIDGSAPVEGDSHLYEGKPVQTSGIAIVKAIAVKNG